MAPAGLALPPLEEPPQPVHVLQVQEEHELEQQPAQLPVPHTKLPLLQDCSCRAP